jgi:hypothetical protein
MGKIIENRHVIDAPEPGPLRYGVFTAATLREMDRRILAAGVQFNTDHCGGAELYDQTCLVSPEKTAVEGSDLMGADPYWVVARKRCGTVGRTAEDMRRAINQQLRSAAQTVVEAAIWDGTGIAPTLSGAGATIVVPGAPGAGAAIAALEEAFYDVYGYQGLIHINSRAEGALRYSGLIDPAERTAGVYRTPMGTAVSMGAGYGITGPADAAPAAGFVWAFITGPLVIWQQEIGQPDPRVTLDRAANQWDVVAERAYAHTWDCPDVFAVQVPIAAPATAATPAVP